ncbi:MAG: hypothetical protein LM593_02970 [Candidatus Verstraetearchaeota archaeon]|jgi:hypothetical protein|nr:hypothetical protein [Candidatus Verstraetearchaeota archaeon]
MSKRPPEKRLRIRRVDGIEKGTCKMNSETYNYLKITDKIEIIVAGKKKIELNAFPFSDVPENEVWANPDEMKLVGIADNTIATVRAVMKK